MDDRIYETHEKGVRDCVGMLMHLMWKYKRLGDKDCLREFNEWCPCVSALFGDEMITVTEEEPCEFSARYGDHIVAICKMPY